MWPAHCIAESQSYSWPTSISRLQAGRCKRRSSRRLGNDIGRAKPQPVNRPAQNGHNTPPDRKRCSTRSVSASAVSVSYLHTTNQLWSVRGEPRRGCGADSGRSRYAHPRSSGSRAGSRPCDREGGEGVLRCRTGTAAGGSTRIPRTRCALAAPLRPETAKAGCRYGIAADTAVR